MIRFLSLPTDLDLSRFFQCNNIFVRVFLLHGSQSLLYTYGTLVPRVNPGKRGKWVQTASDSRVSIITPELVEAWWWSHLKLESKCNKPSESPPGSEMPHGSAPLPKVLCNFIETFTISCGESRVDGSVSVQVRSMGVTKRSWHIISCTC